MAPVKSARKPKPSEKICDFRIPFKVPNCPDGFLDLPLREWTSGTDVADRLGVDHVLKLASMDAYRKTIEAMSAIGRSNLASPVVSFAQKCVEYASTPQFQKDFITGFESRKINENMRIRLRSVAEKSINNAITLTNTSLDHVKEKTSEIIDGLDSNAQLPKEGTTDLNNDDNPSYSAEDSHNDSDGEDMWHDLVGSPEPLVLDDPVVQQGTPEKPKLDIRQLQELEKSCFIAISGMPPSKRATSLVPNYKKAKEEEFKLLSLKSKQQIFSQLHQLLISEDHDNFALSVWLADKEVRDKQDDDHQLFKTICLCLTDFWGLSRNTVREDHERSFWVERVVPFLKFMAVSTSLCFSWCEDYARAHGSSQIIPGVWTNTTLKYFSDGIGRVDGNEKLFMESSSSFCKENIQHTLGDSFKLISLMTSTLNTSIRSYLDCKMSTASGLATYGIQCIKDRITLIKTTISSDGAKYNIVELRSAVVPVKWENRDDLMKLFELIACLYDELAAQEQLAKLLKKEKNQIIEVDKEESVRHVIQDSSLFKLSN